MSLIDKMAPILKIEDSIMFRKHPVQEVTFIQDRNVHLLIKNAQDTFKQIFCYRSQFESLTCTQISLYTEIKIN